jgi:hypothetical protein
MRQALYNKNRLEWHLGDEKQLQTSQGTVWSCRTTSESFGLFFNRLVVALAKSQDHRASCGVFSFGKLLFGKDIAEHHVPVANKKRDAATLTSPAAQPFHRDCENQQKNRQSAFGPRYGRWTIEYGRYASSRPKCFYFGWLRESQNHAGRDSRACPMAEGNHNV